MDNKLSNLTVIIVTFKTDIAILKNCLNSIHKSTNILIVENSENFAHKNEIEGRYKNVEIICSGLNLGMGAGNNFGILKAKTEYVLILNPDIICDKNFFSNITEYLDESSNYSIIGCQYKNNTIWKPAGFFNKKKNFLIKFNNHLTKVDWVVGCSMLVNLKKFDEKKIFDENFFLFFEEFDLCRRTINKGNFIYSSNKLIVNHLGFKGSFATDEKFEIQAIKLKNWHYMWSQFYFDKKYDGFLISYSKGLVKLIKNAFKILINLFLRNKSETIKYKFRFLGLLNSMLARKSFFRVNF